MLEHTRPDSARELSAALREDHCALERTFTQVIAKFRGGDQEAMRACWERLDAELAAHLAAEERLILPRFEQQHPDAAARIQREHREIRTSLESLGVDLDLHALRADAAVRFVEMLRKHAEYEDRQFYVWADAHLAEAERQSVVSRLRALIHAASAR